MCRPAWQLGLVLLLLTIGDYNVRGTLPVFEQTPPTVTVQSEYTTAVTVHTESGSGLRTALSSDEQLTFSGSAAALASIKNESFEPSTTTASTLGVAWYSECAISAHGQGTISVESAYGHSAISVLSVGRLCSASAVPVQRLGSACAVHQCLRKCLCLMAAPRPGACVL